MSKRGYTHIKELVPEIKIVRIADFYDISVDYLVGRTDNKQPSIPSSIEDRIAQLEQMMAQMQENGN